MAYALDDGWDICSPVIRAGNACFGLYSRCGIWVARNTTDGFIPTEVATAYGSPEQIRKLVDVGLWEIVDCGYLAVDYLTLNPTADTVAARRKADAERKAKWREKQAQQQGKAAQRGRKRGTRDTTQESAGSHAVTDGVSPRFPATPKGVRGRPPAPLSGTTVPRKQCPHHQGQPASNCGSCRSERLAGAP